MKEDSERVDTRLLDIEDIVILEDRYRKDMGDIDALAQSIEDVGLLQPIGVTIDNELVFGERRLRACKQLGWTQMRVRVVDVPSIVEGEYAENEVRKDFTHTERVAIGMAVEKTLGERRGRPQKNTENFPAFSETRDIAAERAGFGSGRTYEMAKSVILDAVPELATMMDDEEISISAAAAIAKQEPEAQAEIINLEDARRKDVVADIRKGATYSMNDGELQRKMTNEVANRVQSVEMGFEMVDDAHVTAQEFLNDAFDLTIQNVAERAPRLIAFLETVAKEAADDQKAAR